MCKPKLGNTVFDLGDAYIRVDVESTRAAYAKRDTSLYGGCDCGNCLNLAAQKEDFPSNDHRRWLSSLGVDPSRPTEVVHLAPVDGGHLYTMVYHIRGEFNKGSVVPDLYGDFSTSHQKNGAFVRISNRVGPRPESTFELYPMLQVDIDVTAPWVLDSPEST